MSANRRLCFAFGFFTLCGQILNAQLLPLEINPIESPFQSVTIRGNLATTDVTGAPYSAVEDSMDSQKQPDGTYENKMRTVIHIYRDSHGRTRAEKSITSYLGSNDTHLESIYITDPLTDSLYRLDPENGAATRRSWKAFIKEASTELAPTDPCFLPRPEPLFASSTEALGSRMLDGLIVEGTRQTATAPLNAVGNVRQSDIVVETWVLQELQVAVLTTQDGANGSRVTTRLTQIDRSEPAPELFQVPPDYDMENEPDVRSVVCFTAS